LNIVTGTPEELSPQMMADIAHYRHKVFIDKLGWDLQCENAQECDQFDRPDTVYVVAQGEKQKIVGIARLLPTTRPYLLGEVFPQLLHGLPVPASPDIWELSRFAAVDFNESKTSALSQFSSPVAIALLQASLECAASHGAKKFITVSPLGVERLLRQAGFKAHRLAPSILVNGSPLFACSICCELGPESESQDIGWQVSKDRLTNIAVTAQ
jgi:acyl homoserine lactone synthase